MPGSDLLNSIFLPSGSTIVAPCRQVDYIKKNQVDNGNEVRIWFSAFPELRSINVCGPRDVEFSKDNIGTVNATSMANYMRVAVDDWHMRKARKLRAGGC